MGKTGQRLGAVSIAAGALVLGLAGPAAAGPKVCGGNTLGSTTSKGGVMLVCAALDLGNGFTIYQWVPA
jgi:hypothetical protein